MAVAAVVATLPTLPVKAETAEEQNYALSIFKPGDFTEPKDVTASVEFSTIHQAVAALPAMPNLEQILTQEAKDEAYKTVYAPYAAALKGMDRVIKYEVEAANARLAQSNLPNANDPNTPRLTALSSEVITVMQQLAQTITAYSNIQAAAADYQKINDQSSDEELLHALDGADLTGYALRQLLRQLRQEWAESPEGIAVNKIEADLEARIPQWVATLKKKGRNKCDEIMELPEWWTEGREQENELIAQWNRRVAPRWLAVANAQEEKLKALFTKAIALDEENEMYAKNGSYENPAYRMNKYSFTTIIGQLEYLMDPIRDALRFPGIAPVDTHARVRVR